MPAQKTDDQSKTTKDPHKEELTSGELDKVVGGLKKNTSIGRPTVGVIADPCEGGE
jgi:hypothetical protein